MLQNEATVMRYECVCRVWSKLEKGVETEIKWKSETEKVFEEPH